MTAAPHAPHSLPAVAPAPAPAPALRLHRPHCGTSAPGSGRLSGTSRGPAAWTSTWRWRRCRIRPPHASGSANEEAVQRGVRSENVTGTPLPTRDPPIQNKSLHELSQDPPTSRFVVCGLDVQPVSMISQSINSKRDSQALRRPCHLSLRSAVEAPESQAIYPYRGLQDSPQSLRTLREPVRALTELVVKHGTRHRGWRDAPPPPARSPTTRCPASSTRASSPSGPAARLAWTSGERPFADPPKP